MASNMVKFQRGLQEVYDRTYWQDNVFYYTTDTKNLYIGSVKLSNGTDLSAAIERIADNEEAIELLQQKIAALISDDGTTGLLVDMGAVIKDNQDDIKAINTEIGDAELSTTNKTLIGAINEVLAAVGTGGTAAVVTITESASEDYAKIYTLKQGTTNIGTINIPKDMVVKTGAVEVNPEGQAAGTYIVLTLANATEDKVYVNVGTLVDIYKAAGNANQVQVAIDSATREISATIVAGSITATELADNAVITTKIADANVTKAKLAATVQASLDKADTAMQQANLDTLKTTLQGEIATAKSEAIDVAADDAQDKADDALAVAKNYADTKLVEAKSYADTKAGEGLKTTDFTTGTTNGTFKVKDTEVAVKGLGSAAYTDAEAYDAAGMASTAETNAKNYADSQDAALKTELQDWVSDSFDDLGTDLSAQFQKLETADTNNLAEAKAYTDTQIEAAALVWEDIFENLN